MRQPPVATRNLKDEQPKGIPFSRAVELLEQGYQIKRVAELTGFSTQLLAANMPNAQRSLAPIVPIPVTTRIVHEDDELPLHVPGEIDLIAASWALADHAVARMLEREITWAQVAEVLSSRTKVVTTSSPGHSEHGLRYLLGDISLGVDPVERVVITVAWRWEDAASA